MDKVYLVIGDSGDYSDHTSWPVAAYPDRETAELHAAEANAQTDWENKEGLDYEESEEFMGRFAMDVNCRLQYDGAKYTVVEIPFVLHPDQYQEWVGEGRLKRRGSHA